MAERRLPGARAKAGRSLATLRPPPDNPAWKFPDDLLPAAWVIIASAGEGDWNKESTQWQEAAARWRDEYHKTLKPELPADPGAPGKGPT